MSSDQLTELQDTLSGMRRILQSQTRLIDECLFRLKALRNGDTPPPEGASRKVIDITMTMIHVTGISAHSILKLTGEIGLQARDGYPIARSIIEGVINIAFIFAEGEAAADLAERHAQQKAYRDLERTSSVAGHTISVRWSAKPSHEAQADLAAMVDEFTTKAGRERLAWTDKSLTHRLGVIADHFSSRVTNMLHSATAMVYRHASEIAHGTYFGALFLWGLTSPGKPSETADELRLTLGHHQFAVLCAVIFANEALLTCIGEYLSFDDIAEASDKLVDQLKELPIVKAGLDANPTDQV